MTDKCELCGHELPADDRPTIVRIEATPTIFTVEHSDEWQGEVLCLKRGAIACLSDGKFTKLPHPLSVEFFTRGSEDDHDEVVTSFSPNDFSPIQNYLKKIPMKSLPPVSVG